MHDETKLVDDVDYGAALVLAMMASASTERIRPVDWWTRAKSALETAAASCQDYPSLVSIMGRKLQIDATTKESSAELARIEAAVRLEFERFRRVCERQALYIVALAQDARAVARAERAAKEAT